MTFKSSLKFAKSLIFPKAEKNSSARRSIFGAIICIGLSIVPLVVVMSVSNGLIDGMTERIIGLSSSHIQAFVSSKSSDVVSAEKFIESSAKYSQKIEGIKNSYPQVSVSALVAGKSERKGGEIRAIERDIFERNKDFKKLFTVCSGSVEDFINGNGKDAIVGQKLAADLNLSVGDTFRVITTKIINGKISPKLTSFKIKAIITSGYQELDELWIFLPIEVAYANLSLTNASYSIMFETEDANSPDVVRIQHEIQQSAGRYANVYRWDQIHTAEFENFSSTKVMLIFIMMLIVLVASINISSAIVMLVMERQKEIAILKSIGAAPSGITLSFLITGLACGTGGVILGLPLGLLCSVNANGLIKMLEMIVNWFAKIGYFFKGIPVNEVSQIKLMDPAYYLQEIPLDIPFKQLFFVVAATLVLSLIVSLIPSAKAGKEKPLDILRKN